MLTTALVLGLAVAAPKDPCTLLTHAEVQALAPGAKIGNGVATKMEEIGIECEWKWGAGSGAQSLVVALGDNAKTYPGLSLADLTQGLMAKAAVPGATAVAVTGVGHPAIFDSSSPSRAEATALVKSFTVQVSLFAPDARARKAQVVSLLKSAVGRL